MPRKKVSASPATLPEPGEDPILKAGRFIEDALASARANLDRCLDDIAAYIQRKPRQAIFAAVAAGYILRLLPLTQILGGVLRIALLLLKPAALIYGVAKLWQATQRPVAPHSTPEVS